MKKKILLIVPTLRAGGSERFISILFNYLDRDKFCIRLVLLNSNDTFYALLFQEETILLDKKNVRSSLGAILKIIRTEKPDVVFSTITSLNILLSFIRLFTRSFKLIIRESTVLGIHLKGLKNWAFFKVPIRLLYPHSDCIVCQSKDMKDDMVSNFGLPESKIIVIHNPIVTADFKLKTGPSKRKFTLITVARLDKAKGYDRILKALSYLHEDYEYLVVGDLNNPDLKAEFDNLVLSLGLDDRVKRIGMKTMPQVYLELADVYLHGSYYEGFPNALLEAGSVGIPVVTFNTTGINEIMMDGVNGFIVDDNDLKGFAEGIRKSLYKKFDRQQIRDIIELKFGVRKIIKQYEALFESVTN